MEKKKADQLIRKLQEDYNFISTSFSRSRQKVWPELSFLFEQTEQGERVLDVGCGNGRFFQYLQNCDYTGVDFSEKLIEEAKKIFPNASFVLGNALDLPFLDNSFDKIYSIALIHHIPSEEYRVRVLQEMSRVVKPEGKIFVTVWNRKKDFNDYETTVPFNGRHRYYHLFQKGELSSLAVKAGLSVIEEGVAEEEKRSNFYLVAKSAITKT